MAYQSPRHSQNFYQYDASTPPPPPPKPGGSATPASGPPLPPPPQSYNDQQQNQQNYHQHNRQPDQLAVQPPEEGWLPEVLRDKTYVNHET
jgi:hypothetical protein